MTVFKEFQTCLGTAFQQPCPRPRTTLARLSPGKRARPIERQTSASGIPNTLPPQDLRKECWSLAASGFAPRATSKKTDRRN